MRQAVAMTYRRQRVRDPLHGLIEFDARQFEDALWCVIQSRPFQRLRRVKQLGFSEVVFPGATHTRLAHCLGTFHIGRLLMAIVQRDKGTATQDSTVQHVLAATLLHDVGHGPFSHAFEDVGKQLKLTSANHEIWSERLIRETEIADILGKLTKGFADDVADIIKRGRPGDMYEAVVSSQFDADRLDYMQRDRLMTGTHHGAIDFAWLLANLEVGEVKHGQDDDAEFVGTVETFVLGPKAVSAAETYVLGLLQLYQTVYLHKVTRGIEKLFSELLLRVVKAVQAGDVARTGLPATHPIARFAQNPDNVECYLALDDAVVWGALSMLADSSDSIIAELSKRIRDRKLYRSVDVMQRVEQECSGRREPTAAKQHCVEVFRRLDLWRTEHPEQSYQLLLDHAKRDPYRRFSESKGPLNQIRIRSEYSNDLVDIISRSPVVEAIPLAEYWRAYVPKDDTKLRKFVENTVREVINEQRN